MAVFWPAEQIAERGPFLAELAERASHLYSKPVSKNWMMLSDVELDIGKFGFEIF